MNQFKHCPVIEVGDVFTRVDRNGKRVPTAKYVLDCKEEQSAHSRYDRSYSFIKYGDGIERSNENVEEAFKLFYKYCEE